MGVPLLWSNSAFQELVSMLATCPITQLISTSQVEFPKESMSSCAPFLLKLFLRLLTCRSSSDIKYCDGNCPVWAATLLSLPALPSASESLPFSVPELVLSTVCEPQALCTEALCTEPVPQCGLPAWTLRLQAEVVQFEGRSLPLLLRNWVMISFYLFSMLFTMQLSLTGKY